MEAPLEYILSCLLFVFILVAITAFEKWHEHSKAQKLRDLVSWSVIKSKPNELLVHAHDLPLWAYLKNAQLKYLSQEYRISGDDEWQSVNEILEEYQKDLTQSYFRGHLKLIKSKYEVQAKDYFMLMLHVFLFEHQCDDKFLGYDMHQERIACKSYGSTFSAGSDSTYTLSDFAIVFHKMHYITYMYCRGNDILKDLVPEWNEKNLIKILDTKQIEISRF